MTSSSSGSTILAMSEIFHTKNGIFVIKERPSGAMLSLCPPGSYPDMPVGVASSDAEIMKEIAKKLEIPFAELKKRLRDGEKIKFED